MRIQEGDVSVELPNNSRAVVRFVRAGSRRNSFNTYTLEVAALRGPGVVDLRGLDFDLEVPETKEIRVR
jgi:hypothetical protein